MTAVLDKNEQLIDRSLTKLIGNLNRYGNNVSNRQTKALKEILTAYTEMASGQMKGRYAFPLGTGLGKTQSIVAWLSAANEIGLLDDISVAVSASKIEALCELKRDLIENGIPKHMIGLIHSYKYSEIKAEEYLDDEWADLP